MPYAGSHDTGIRSPCSSRAWETKDLKDYIKERAKLVEPANVDDGGGVARRAAGGARGAREPAPKRQRRYPSEVPGELDEQGFRALLPDQKGCSLYVDNSANRYRVFYTSDAGRRLSWSRSWVLHDISTVLHDLLREVWLVHNEVQPLGPARLPNNDY